MNYIFPPLPNSWSLLDDGLQLLTDRGEKDLQFNYARGLERVLLCAATGHRWDVAKEMVTRGADVNAAGKWTTPLNEACDKGNAEIVRFLLDHRADVNRKTPLGITVLLTAVRRGHEEIVRLLLANGADPNAEKAGETPLNVAAKKGHQRIAELLRKAGARE